MNQMTLQIDPNQMRIHVESKEQGVVSCKNISLDTFFECIKQSLQRERTTSGFLPEHCFHFAVDTSGERDYCLWYPQLRADISYYGTEYPDFPLPRLVFGFRVSVQGKIMSCSLGVIDDEAPREMTRMYTYPFSNVSRFSLCTGNNALPVYRKPHTLATLPGFLLRLTNNNDHFQPSNNKLLMQHRELLEHLKDKDTAYYYTDVLIPSGRTLKDFAERR